MKLDTSRTLAAFRERLLRLRVGRHPALFFNPWIEGYRDYVFGGKVGPVVQTSAVFHEIAHAAQFGSEMFTTRATPGGFRFKVPRVFVYDRFCVEPKTAQATLRELETFAYQLHLMRAAGYKVSDRQFMDYSAMLMTKYMHDWWHIPGGCDESRTRNCSNVIAECFARVSRLEVIDRLEAWLDATAKRLKRQNLAYPANWSECSVKLRYHSDGTVWRAA